jgi:integrase
MQPMPKQKLPYVNRHVNRHGKVYWFFRARHGERIRLPGDYGSPEWRAAYDAALAGQTVGKPPEVRASGGTLRWLVEHWKRSSDWAGTSIATRKQRDNILQHVLAKSGDRAVKEITDDAIRAGREKRQATPAAANNFLKTMRALFRWAKEEKLVDADHAKDVKFIKVKTEGFAPWTMEDVEAYRACWDLGTRERLALEILINTGLRRSDLVRVGRQHVRDHIIHIRAGKNGVELYIPILPRLSEALAAGPVGDMSFLSSQYGRPMTKESFGNVFKGWCRAAGIKGKSAHGIRKLAATILANSGGSEQELQALFGWTTNTMSAVYTREANRKKQALQAAFKMLQEMERNDETVKRLPTPLGQLPTPLKKG